MWRVWQTLGESLFFFRRHFFVLAGLLAPVVLPFFVLSEYRTLAVLHGDDKLTAQDPWVMVVNALVGVFAGALTTLYTVAEIDGDLRSRTDLMRGALLAVPALMALQLLVFFAFLGGALFFIVPGFWLLACLLPASVYVVAERQPVPQAMQRSFVTFRPMAWELLMALVLAFAGILMMGLLVTVAASLITGLSSLPLRVLLDALTETLCLLLSQFLQVLLVRYYDRQRQPGAVESGL